MAKGKLKSTRIKTNIGKSEDEEEKKSNSITNTKEQSVFLCACGIGDR